MSYQDFGDIPIMTADDANIPVVCFLSPPGDSETYPDKWVWSASNFMPRKEYATESAYEIVADTKEEILEALEKYVTPLYAAALENLRETGENYYWTKRKK